MGYSHVVFAVAALAQAAATPAAMAGTTTRVSVSSGGAQGNGESVDPALSADGRFAAFISAASNLVPGDTNAHHDAFVRDRVAGTTTRVSISSGGAQANGNSGSSRTRSIALSADGRFVAFVSYASNLVPSDTNSWGDVFVHDRRTGTTRRVSLGPDGAQGNGHSFVPVLSADGWFVAFRSFASNLVPGDTNGVEDVLVHTR